MRTIRPDIDAIESYGRRRYEKTGSQYFCETPKAFELWAKFPDDSNLDYRIGRWQKSRIWAVNNEVL